MHLHYSPFQFATDVEASENDVSAMKVAKTLKTLTKKDESKAKDMGCTMPCAAAESIPGTPTAFISPNPTGVMKDLKMPMAPMGIAPAPKSAPHIDHSYRNRGRVAYGDRMV